VVWGRPSFRLQAPGDGPQIDQPPHPQACQQTMSYGSFPGSDGLLFLFLHTAPVYRGNALSSLLFHLLGEGIGERPCPWALSKSRRSFARPSLACMCMCMVISLELAHAVNLPLLRACESRHGEYASLKASQIDGCLAVPFLSFRFLLSLIPASLSLSTRVSFCSSFGEAYHRAS
jgi:hypothetical protein